MVLKNVFPVLLGAALLAGSVALAAGYRPDQYFDLDLSKAALSPTPLGPPSQFAPARPKPAPTAAAAQPDAALVPQAKKVALERIAAPRPRKVAARVAAPAPRAPLRTKVARRRANTRNALAWAPPIRTWPCNPRLGGICLWKK